MMVTPAFSISPFLPSEVWVFYTIKKNQLQLSFGKKLPLDYFRKCIHKFLSLN